MPLNTKTIKRRIKSISSTKKITKAMEMISAVKMRKAVANVLATRSYSGLAWEILKEIAEKTHEKQHAMLEKRPVRKIGIVLITSNRGLAGGFSSRLLQAVDEFIKSSKRPTVIPSEPRGDEESLSQPTNDGQRFLTPATGIRNDNTEIEIDADIILTGKRGKKIYHKFGHTVVAEFDKIDLTSRVEEVLPMARHAVGEYLSGKYDQIVIAYTDFVSAVNQVSKIKQLLPLNETNDETPLSVSPLVGERNRKGQTSDGVTGATVPSPYKGEDGGRGFEALDDELEPTDYEDAYFGDENKETEESQFLFEPTTHQVLNELLPRLVEMQIYQAILESDASEHSSRMMAMQSASDAAGEMIKELNYSFNKARQAAITQEISEIVGGAAALE